MPESVSADAGRVRCAPSLLALACEFTGTLLLVLVVTMHSNETIYESEQPMGVAVTLGFLVLVGNPISGSNYNPAVTLALRIVGDAEHRQHPAVMAAYVAVQNLGGLVGAFIGHALKGYSGLPAMLSSDTAGTEVALLLVSESMACVYFIGLVLYAVFYPNLHPRAAASMSPLVFASFIAAAAYSTVMLFRLRGALFNPALATALWLSGAGPFAGTAALTWLMYILAQIVGTAVAALIVRAALGRLRSGRARKTAEQGGVALPPRQMTGSLLQDPGSI